MPRSPQEFYEPGGTLRVGFLPLDLEGRFRFLCVEVSGSAPDEIIRIGGDKGSYRCRDIGGMEGCDRFSFPDARAIRFPQGGLR